MNIHFADWYRDAHIEPSDELLRKRWAGVEAITKTLKPGDLIDLSRVFYRLSPNGPDFDARFRKAFHDADATFSPNGNATEIGVLAGASLLAAVEMQDKLQYIAILSAVVPSLQGKGSAPTTSPIVSQAYEFMRKGILDSRQAADKGASQSKQSLEDAARTLQEALVTGGATIQTTTASLTAFSQAIVAKFKGITKRVDQVEERYSTVREEANILWWLVSGHSRSYEKPYRSLPAAAIPLLIGKELADLVESPLGPFAAVAVLDKVLQDIAPGKADLLVSEAIAAIEPRAAQAWNLGDYGEQPLQICPVLYACRELSKTGDANAAVSAASKITGSSLSVRCDTHQLAKQVYEETLLLKSFQSLTKDN